ncbi:c-type cytochrome [Congregicoccus parvus]|uniref:c-type cytochrome n=1 Tax=Congregicoccus parvus TaxID=3081749 RepID=UPI003FA54BEE
MAASAVDGLAVYREHCAVCHMDDGHGVPNMQPGIVGSSFLEGDPVRLYAVIRAGSAALRDRPSEYGNEMPPFGMLSEEEVAAVTSYIRERFGRDRGS